MHILLTIYHSWFLPGMFLGIIGYRIFDWIKVRELDKVRPLPSGGHRKASGVNRVWVGGLAAVLALGYVVLKTQETQDQTVALTNRFGQCQTEFQTALTERSKIAQQDSDLSNRISDVRSELDRALGVYLDRVINPPAEIAGLPANDPRRIAWKDDMKVVYADWARTLRSEIGDIVAERKRLADWRRVHPLPDIAC